MICPANPCDQGRLSLEIMIVAAAMPQAIAVDWKQKAFVRLIGLIAGAADG